MRLTRHYYAEPGSFERITEAALAYADADSERDSDYHRRRCRLRAACLSWARAHPEIVFPDLDLTPRVHG